LLVIPISSGVNTFGLEH